MYNQNLINLLKDNNEVSINLLSKFIDYSDIISMELNTEIYKIYGKFLEISFDTEIGNISCIFYEDTNQVCHKTHKFPKFNFIDTNTEHTNNSNKLYLQCIYEINENCLKHEVFDIVKYQALDVLHHIKSKNFDFGVRMLRKNINIVCQIFDICKVHYTFVDFSDNRVCISFCKLKNAENFSIDTDLNKLFNIFFMNRCFDF